MTKKESKKAQRALEKDIQRLAEVWGYRLQKYVQAWLDNHNGPVNEIIMAMGDMAFYGRDGRYIPDDDLPKRALPLIEFAGEYEVLFGSPGFRFTRTPTK